MAFTAVHSLLVASEIRQLDLKLYMFQTLYQPCMYEEQAHFDSNRLSPNVNHINLW